MARRNPPTTRRLEPWRRALKANLDSDAARRAQVDRWKEELDQIVKSAGPKSIAARQANRVHESRLLGFVQRPVLQQHQFRHDLLELATSHENAWGKLLALRSIQFLKLLHRFARSGRRDLRASAAQYITWMGFDRSLPLIRELF